MTAEWNKTCKLLTSGNFFLTISHNPEVFHERWFYSICKDTYPLSQTRISELEFILQQRHEAYLEKLSETPFLGYDFHKKPLYSFDEQQISHLKAVYRFTDPEDCGMVARSSLLTFFAFHRGCHMQKSFELSQAKKPEDFDSAEGLIKDFEDCLFQTNLANRDIFTKRECLNFLAKLLSNPLLTPDTLLRKALDFYSGLSKVFPGGFLSKVFDDIRLAMVTSPPDPKSELANLLMFSRIDLWVSIGRLRDGPNLKELTAKREELILETLLNSYITFKKNYCVLKGDGSISGTKTSRSLRP